MTLRWGDVGWALATFLALVALSLAVVRFLPPLYMEQLISTGLDIPEIVNQTVVLGVVISAIALAKVMVDRASVAHLLLSISSEAVSVVFAFLVVGAGNIGSLGYSSFRLTKGKLTTVIALDLRVFIWLTVVIVGVSVIQIVAQFREARAEKAAAPK